MCADGAHNAINFARTVNSGLTQSRAFRIFATCLFNVVSYSYSILQWIRIKSTSLSLLFIGDESVCFAFERWLYLTYRHFLNLIILKSILAECTNGFHHDIQNCVLMLLLLFVRFNYGHYAELWMKKKNHSASSIGLRIWTLHVLSRISWKLRRLFLTFQKMQIYIILTYLKYFERAASKRLV